MTVESPLNTAAAAQVHYTDPRVRQLAEARWRLITGGTRMDWLSLGKDSPEALISQGRDWIRAAVAAGILPPPGPTTAERLEALPLLDQNGACCGGPVAVCGTTGPGGVGEVIAAAEAATAVSSAPVEPAGGCPEAEEKAAGCGPSTGRTKCCQAG